MGVTQKHANNPGNSPKGFAGISALAILTALAAAIMALCAGPGYGFGWWHYRLSFNLLRWAEWIAYAALILGLIALNLSAMRRAYLRLAIHALAFIVAIAVVIAVNQFWGKAAEVPPIHDISTDLIDPPAFEAVLPLRGEHANPIDYAGAEVAEQQTAAYPDLRPIQVQDAPASAFSAARDVIAELGWEVISVEPARGRIEAVAITPWFGFRDDVVVRVRPAERGSVVDVRSKSRVGVSDLGANAERIRNFVTAFSRRTQVL